MSAIQSSATQDEPTSPGQDPNSRPAVGMFAVYNSNASNGNDNELDTQANQDDFAAPTTPTTVAYVVDTEIPPPTVTGFLVPSKEYTWRGRPIFSSLPCLTVGRFMCIALSILLGSVATVIFLSNEAGGIEERFDALQEQKQALRDILKAIGYDVSNVSNGCDVPGVTCNKESIVTEITLSGHKLDGTIPKILSNVENLRKLDLSNNNLKGTIPVDIFHVEYLAYLDLGNNALSGSVPSELGKLDSLEFLDISNNDLTGNLDFLCDASFQLVSDIQPCSLSPTFTPTLLRSNSPSIVTLIPSDAPSRPTPAPTGEPSHSTTPTQSPSVTAQPSKRQDFILETQLLSWDAHASRAASKGYALASVLSDEDVVSVLEISKGLSQFWIGGRRSVDYRGERWVWTDGRAINHTYWAAHEPNNAQYKENCIEMKFNWNGQCEWNDLDCSAYLFAVYRKL